MIGNEITMDLSAVVAALEPKLREMIGANIALQLNLEPEGLWAKADAGQIEQVVVNLITNARDAMRSFETSRVKVDKDLLCRKLRGGALWGISPPVGGLAREALGA